VNLATSYGAKCALDVTTLAKPEGPEELKDAAAVQALESNIEAYIQKGKVLGKWVDFKGQKSAFFYIIGPADDSVLNTLYPAPTADLAAEDAKHRDEQRRENTQIHTGTLEVDPLVLSALYQEVRDLADKMKASEKNGSAA